MLFVCIDIIIYINLYVLTRAMTCPSMQISLLHSTVVYKLQEITRIYFHTIKLYILSMTYFQNMLVATSADWFRFVCLPNDDRYHLLLQTPSERQHGIKL